MRVLLWLVVGLPFLLGILAGLGVRVTVWTALLLWRAMLQGYEIGRTWRAF